ncbi:uncharacterized protein LOC136073900 [Hydra vulgaris]|uniref:uncharacterized protein LOC136073900 n=1 Tax=Hydra vulgaris TaxID=6087 RepID=UPI0032EA4612
MAEKHQQKLLRVCRICGNLTGRDSIKTSSRRERILNIFKINIAEDCLDVHPTQMCLKCNATMVNIENRGSTLLKPIPKAWLKCQTNVCDCVFGKVGRKPKPNVGRPGIFKRWTQITLNLFLESLPLPLKQDQLSELNFLLNPHLTLCICKICEKIMHQPVMIKDCQRSFCSLCITLLIKGKLEKEAKCPICSSFIMDTYEVHDCQKDHLKSEHSTIIDDFYKVNESSDVPRNIEAAVVHVIKQKLEHSKTTTIEFSSGGPRPLCLTVTPKAYKESASCSISTLKKRHRLLMEEVNHQVGNSKDSQVMQAAVMLKSFDNCKKEKFCKMLTLELFNFLPRNWLLLKLT